VEIVGKGAIVTVVEDFDHGPSELQLSRRVDTWGDRIQDTRSAVDIVDTGEGGKAARWSFTAAFDTAFSLPAWKDSGLQFVGTAELPAPGQGAQGVAFRMKPEGFTVVEVYLVQEDASGTRSVVVPLFANDGTWKDWRIPFSAFSPTDPGPSVDFTRPMRLELLVPLEENWNAWHFRTATKAEAALSLDAVGFWRPAAADDAATLEIFDDVRDRLPFAVDLYGSSIWTDYSVTNAGETKVNDGVTAQRLTLTRKPGTEGNALVLDARLELTPSIAAFHKAGQSLTVFLKAPLGIPLGGAHGISFLVRSTLAQAGTIEIQDEQNDRSFSAGFSVIGSWTRVRIPFEKLTAGDETLASAARLPARTRLQLSFELPPAEVERAAASGVLSFSIDLDSFALTP
jgi:hypothetical protein